MLGQRAHDRHQSYQKHWTNTMTKTDTLEKLEQKITDFRDKRNWRQFHTPKNLAMALSVECAELVEIFQWMTPEQSARPDEPTSAHIRQEIGDIMIYLSLISSSFDIDPLEAALEKMELNESRYPQPPAT
jgi:NTP pyrophosphatase (non-canonical NTP hydrolase)